MKDKPKPSLFAQRLRGLLSAECFPKSGLAPWARYLDVTESAISQWLNDKTIPRPTLLYMIFNLVAGLRTETAGRVLREFKEMANRPSDQSISPHFERLQPTVWDYMTSPPFQRPFNEPNRAPEEVTAEPIVPPMSASQMVSRALLPGAMDFLQTERRSRYEPVDHFVCRVMRPEGMRDVTVSKLKDISVGNILLSGPPGIGKTALLKHLCYVEQSGGRVVQYIGAAQNLTTFSSEASSILEQVRSDQDSSTVVVIDSLNEVPFEERAAYRDVIRQLFNRSIQLVLVTRSTSFDWTDNSCIKAELQSLPVRTAHSFFRRKLNNALILHPEYKWKSLSVASLLDERPYLASLRKNPGFLTVAADVLASSGNLMPEYAILKGWIDGYLFHIGQRSGEHQSMLRLEVVRRLARAASFAVLRRRDKESLEFTTDLLSDDDEWRSSVEFASVLARRTDEQWLDLLAEETGVFARVGHNSWRVRHRVLQEILSADHIVHSVESISKLLRAYDLGDEHRFRALRYACSATTDASDLVKYIVENARGTEGEKSVLFAELLVSFFNADKELVNQCSSHVCSWLEKTANYWEWSIQESSDPNIRWQAEARLVKGGVGAEDTKSMIGVIDAVHRSRLYEHRKMQWRQEFAKIESAGVRQLASVLDQEGVLASTDEKSTVHIAVRERAEQWIDDGSASEPRIAFG